MKIAIFGLGYVGLTSAACLIDQGYEVIGVDINEFKINQLNQGKSPINEPGVEQLLKKGIENGTFSATTNTYEAIRSSSLSFVCVGTPSSVSGAHDMSFIANVSKQIAEAISTEVKNNSEYYHEVVFRSTMAPGTIDNLITPIFKRIGESACGKNWELLYNPEFLRESTAIKDYFNPPKIVIGSREGVRSNQMEKIYLEIDAPRFHVGYRESEITKFLDNSFHALKVAFGNEIGRICNTLDINTEEVMEIFLSDTKLNISPYYLRPGGAFGGSCLPKDVRALGSISHANGIKSEILNNIMTSNQSHKQFLCELIENKVKLEDKILFVGVSFKSNTDDLRESPQIDIIQNLLGKGYSLNIYDPDVQYGDIHGKNLAFSHAKIPHIESLLLSDEEIMEASFDKVIISKSLELPISIDESKVIKIDRI